MMQCVLFVNLTKLNIGRNHVKFNARTSSIHPPAKQRDDDVKKWEHLCFSFILFLNLMLHGSTGVVVVQGFAASILL